MIIIIAFIIELCSHNVNIRYSLVARISELFTHASDDSYECNDSLADQLSDLLISAMYDK